MPPKRQKSGGGGGSAGGGNAGAAGAANTSQYKWEAGLVGAAFNDDEWKAAVAIVVPLKAEDRKNIQVLQEAVAAGSRRLFSVIEPNEMFKIAQELGNPKQKKEKNTPVFFEVNELIKQYLDQNEAIPVQIMARLIKWHLLSIKTNDLKRREEEKKSADKGKAGGKAAPGGKKGADRQKSAGKGAKDKGKGGVGSADVPPAPRKETKLRKRGEEDDDSKYIDDEPDDGPQHYVMIFGQSDALLVQALNDIGVYVDVVLCLKTDDYEGYDPKPLTGDEPGEGGKNDDKNKYEEPLTKAQMAMMAQNELERAEREKHQQVYSRFWFELPIVLKQAPPKSKIRDTVQLDHQVDFESIPNSVDFDVDIRVGFGSELFETSACLLYDMFDWKRQYCNYLENTHFQNIPEITNSGGQAKAAPLTTRGEEASAPAKTAAGGEKPGKKGAAAHIEQVTPRKESGADGAGDDQMDSGGSGFLDLNNVDLNFYNDLLAGVPSECVSVELLLHSLLEQVTASTTSGEDVGEDKSKNGLREDGLDASLAEHLSGLFLKLALSDEEKKAIEKKLGAQTEAEKQKSETKLVNFRDNLSLRLQSLKGLHSFDPIAAEKTMLSLTPSAALLNYPKPSVQEQREIAARFQDVMMHCAHGSMTQAEINHALKQFIFECIKLKETDENGSVQNTASSDENKDFIVPWDDPHPFLEKHTEQPPPKFVEEGVTGGRADTRSSAEGSRPSSSIQGTGGILKRAPSASSSKGASVSFAEGKTSGAGVDHGTPKAVTPDQAEVADLAELPVVANDKISEDDTSLPQDVNSPQPPPNHDKGEQFLGQLSGAQLRNLDQWCYMEHFERDTFIQVLEESRYQLPYLEVYYCRKDNTLLLTLYSPTNGNCFNSSDWFSYLHTDVGFRNYLDYIQDKIKEWTEKEEEKYLFDLAEKERLAAMSPSAVAAEVAAAAAAANEETARGKTGGGKRSRSQSPKTGRKGSANRSKSPKNKEEESEEEKEDQNASAGGISKQFMRPNSMKVWKLEQDKIKEAEEKKKLEKEKAAAGGGGKGKASAKKGGSPAGSRDGSRSRSGSRGGASRSPSKERKGKKGGKSDTKKGNDDSTASQEKTEAALPDALKEAINKEFRGYKLGDELVHCIGKTSSLFACDGAQIRVESTKFYEGPSHVRLTLLEGKNVLNLHLGDPLPVEPETESTGGVSGDMLQSTNEGGDGVTSESFDKKKDVSSELQETATDNVGSSMKIGTSVDSSKQLEISISKATPTMDESASGQGGEDSAAKKNKKDKKKGPSEYGSFTAKLSDGINLSFSCYGHSGLNPDIEKAIKCIDMKAPTPPTAAAPEVKPEKGGSAKGKKGKASAGKKGKNTAPAPETPPPAPTTPPAGDKVDGDGALLTRGTDATGLLGQDEVDQAAQMGALQARDFQQLHVSAPNGLTINYYLEKSNEDSVLPQEDFSALSNSLLIEQCYPFKCTSQQQAQNEGITNSTAWKEKTRLITSQGNVIKLLQNGKIEVLCADGTRLEYSGPWIDPNVVLANLAAGPAGGVDEPTAHRPDSQASDPEKNSRPGTASKKGTAKSPTRKSPRPPGQEGAPASGADGSLGGGHGGGGAKDLDAHERGIITWTYVTGIGERLVTNGKGEREKREDLKYYTASDPETMEVLMVREDRVMMVSRPDSSLIVDHNDGTRITTFYKEQQLPPPPSSANSGADPTAEIDPLNEASSRQVRFVKIECDGFATLVFNTEDSSCTTFFGSQTNLFAHPTGLYVSSCADGSAIVISQKGEVVYVSKPDNDVIGYLCNCDTFDKLPEDVLKSNVYVLKHDHSSILNHVASNGAVFKVNSVGEMKIDNSTKNAELDDQSQALNLPTPRYFILNPDQSGDELIRHDDVIGLLQQSEQDPATVVLVDPLPEHPNIKGVTVMQPSFSDTREKWVIPRDEANIIPKNLTSRDLKTIPPKEYKKPGPKFGTNVGKGLNVGSLKPHEAEETVPVYPKMPETVTLRQFVGYPEVKEELRTALKEGFKSYCETVDQNVTYMKSIKKVDPRSAEEIEKSLEMERKMNERWMSNKGNNTAFCGDLGNENPFSSSIMREKTGEDTSKVAKLYQEATKPVSPPPQKRAQPKRTGSAWERDKSEVQLEKDNRLKLRNKEIPPYFQSYLGRDFVEKQKQSALEKDLREATEKLPYYENKKRIEKLSQKEESVNNIETGQEKHEEEVPEKDGKDVTQATEEAATRQGEENGSNSEKEMIIEPFTHNYISTEESCPGRDQDQHEGYPGDLSARDMHSNTMNIPPYKTPNQKFLRVEDPVKRKSNTTAIAGAAEPALLGALRGFMLRPRKVNFGVLREGYTYGVNLFMRNIGLDNCRFRIKNPPPSTGLSASYKPGPVAAGMSQQIQLVLFALANPSETENTEISKCVERSQVSTNQNSAPQRDGDVDEVETLLHHLVITTEAEIFNVPVLAKVLPANIYDSKYRSSETGIHGHSNLAYIISTQPVAPRNPIKRESTGGSELLKPVK